MAEALFTGVGVALVTLFDERQEVDTAATAELAARLCATGLRAFLVCGTTGEAAALSPEERVGLITAVRAAVPAEFPVIAGTGAPSTYQALGLSRAAVDSGADAVLALTPPRTRDVASYYSAIRQAVDVPLLAYHYPAAAAPGIDLETLFKLDVAGCKDSSGDPQRLLAEVTRAPFPIYVGSSALLCLAGPLGATGAILALANAAPELCVAAFSGDADAQRELAPAHLAAAGAFPGGIKGLVAKRFHTSSVARLG